MFTQQQFLGASISNFNGSIGWATQPSTLSVTLVEDPKAGDDFTPPPVGTPVVFNYSGWVFRGLLQTYKYSKSSSGFIYNVTVVDPREILDGVQLITNLYDNQISTPNVINVYGYHEQTAGNSEVNEGGMPWRKVRDAINIILAGGTSYGGPISLRNVLYTLDLTALPNLDANYRVGAAGSMSLMEFIQEICDATSRDFFFSLDPGNVIRLYTIDRSVAPPMGLLSNYLASATNVVSSEVGVEFRNDVCGKIIVGGNRIDMFGQVKSGQAIWPFWGFKPDNNLEVGTGLGNDHTFELDSRHIIYPGVIEAKYKTDVRELRAALESRESWESFLAKMHEVDTPQTNPHYYKHGLFKNIGYVKKIEPEGKQPTPQSILATKVAEVENASNFMEKDHEEAIARIFAFISGAATDLYGKKFMVDIPDVEVWKEPETEIVRVSYEPVDAGYFNSDVPNVLTNLKSLNKIPTDNLLSPFFTEDGRLKCYARFDDVDNLDFSEIPEDSIFFNDDKSSAFVICQANPGVAFENVNEIGSGDPKPRAVITLPGAVRARTGENRDNYYSHIIDQLDEKIAAGEATKTQKNNLLHAFGVDNTLFGNRAIAVIPDFVAIPLKNNKERYGPWSAYQANGKIIYEVDDNLVPWNYGGFTKMNLVGNAKSQETVSSTHEVESGSVEIAGVPAYTLGQQLVSGGLYITDIDVSVGQQGVTSIYRFSTWTPEFGRLSKANIDRLSRITKGQQEIKNKLRGSFIKTDFAKTNLQRMIRKTEKTKRKGGTSSHNIFSGEGFPYSEEDDNIYPNVWVQPAYNFTSQLGLNYEKKAGMSVDGLLRPFSTNPSGYDVNGTLTHADIFIPRFVKPAENAEFPTVTDLNPFQSGHDISIVLRESSIPPDLALSQSPYYGNDLRPMALRGPLVIAGWGYDTNGEPVPGVSGEFTDGYLTRQDLWKVGPLDSRWDEDRGVWVAGGSNRKVVRLMRDPGSPAPFPSGYRSVYYAEELGLTYSGYPGSQVSVSGTGKFLNVGNFRENICVLSGIYIADQIAGKYYIDNQLTFFGGQL